MNWSVILCVLFYIRFTFCQNEIPQYDFPKNRYYIRKLTRLSTTEGPGDIDQSSSKETPDIHLNNMILFNNASNITQSNFEILNTTGEKSPNYSAQDNATSRDYQRIITTVTADSYSRKSNFSMDDKTTKSQLSIDVNQELACGNPNNSDIPWIAVLVHRDPSGRDHRRTLSKGVLIDNKNVLTTVSSIHNTHPFWIVTEVRLGDHPTWIQNTERNRSEVLSIPVDSIYQHQNKDIAIIRLSEIVTFSDNVQPICLPDDNEYNYPELFQHMCKRFKTHKHVEVLSSQPVSQRDCAIIFHRKKAQFTDEEFCSWDEFGDTCTGDLGGPLVTRHDGKYILVGLNSYAVSEKPFNAEDYPGVYVKVGSYINWISNVVENLD